MFSNRPRRRAEKAREEEAQRAHFFFRDVRVRIAVASGNVTQTFLGGFQGRYERVLFGEACEKLAKEARKAKPRELLLANDEYDDPERKRRLIRREEKKQRNIRIKALTPSKSQRDETVAIVFIHVTLRASMSTREVQTLRRFRPTRAKGLARATTARFYNSAATKATRSPSSSRFERNSRKILYSQNSWRREMRFDSAAPFLDRSKRRTRTRSRSREKATKPPPPPEDDLLRDENKDVNYT